MTMPASAPTTRTTASMAASFTTPIRPGGPGRRKPPGGAAETVLSGDGCSAERRPALQRPCDYGPKVGSDGTFGWGRRIGVLLPKQEGPVNSRCTKGYVIMG